ncbi:MAG: hypothetical protein H6725_21135 [Sandaracinaceae bacterium]|nr:hypothetical protein [Sandaracinaceae bacterium]
MTRAPHRQPKPAPDDRRRRWAWLALALWCAGFEAAPLGHVAWHDALAPHEHGRAGARTDEPRAGDEGHGHPHGDHHHHAHRGRAARAHAPLAAVGFSAWRDHGGARGRWADEGQQDDGQQDDGRDPVVDGPEVAPQEHHGDGEGDRDERADEGESPTEHGAGSLAHRDLAALLPLPGLPPVPLAPFWGYLTFAPLPRAPRAGSAPLTRARAPPMPTNIHTPA